MARQKSTHVDSAEAVGLRIREIRERRELRQRDLAFPGCTAAYISRIEAGARIPSLQLLREIGKRLGVSADYLAQGEEASSELLALKDAQIAQSLGELDTAREGFGRLAASDDEEARKGALLGLAQLALLDGENERGIELLEEYDRLAANDTTVDAAAVEALARAHSIRGDLAAVLGLLEQKIELAAGDPVVHFRLTVTLANALIDLGQLDRAETIIGDSFAELGSSPDPIAFARCLWSQSRLQTARGNSDLAVRYAEQALATIKATEHEEYAARAHHLLAYIELERGNAQRAHDILAEAMPLIERSGDRNAVALFRLEQARALAQLGEVDQARELASELVREVEHLSRVDAARSLSVLAGIFATTGDTGQALDLYELAANALADRPNAPMLVDVYTRWSDLLAQTGDTEQALQVARRALTSRQSPARQ